jgi:hypothetical protein
MSPGRLAFALLVPALAALTPSPAASHGPCGCLDPVLAQVGAKVRITGGPGVGEAGGRGWPAYRAVFNPRPTDLGIAPDYLTGAYRPEAPTVTVLSRSRKDPTRRGSFRVPKTPDGLYMVLIFDGGEGGAHNTWDYLHVVDRTRHEPGRQPPATTPTRQRTRTPSATTRSNTDPALAALLGGATGGIVTLAGAYLVARRRRGRD